MSAVVSAKTRADVEDVARFFGVEMEWNRHIFAHAASRDPKAFETTFALLAEAVRQDVRNGVTQRIRDQIAKGRAAK